MGSVPSSSLFSIAAFRKFDGAITCVLSISLRDGIFSLFYVDTLCIPRRDRIYWCTNQSTLCSTLGVSPSYVGTGSWQLLELLRKKNSFRDRKNNSLDKFLDDKVSEWIVPTQHDCWHKKSRPYAWALCSVWLLLHDDYIRAERCVTAVALMAAPFRFQRVHLSHGSRASHAG